MDIIKQVGLKNQVGSVNINFHFHINSVNIILNGEESEKKEQSNQTFDIEFSEIMAAFKEKKLENMRLEQAYVKMELFSKAERVHQCSTFLEFLVHEDGKKKLLKSNFCRDRLCPECAWRRSLKIYSENSRCFENLGSKSRFIFLTVTCKNVAGKELRSEITKYVQGFTKMLKRKEIKSYVLGTIRALEVTYKKEDSSFHPHIHCIIHVSNNYFSRGYINQVKWTSMWSESMNLDYTPLVFVKALKVNNPQNMGRELAEVSKYCVKFNSIMHLQDSEFFKVIEILANALHARRLITFTGTFREARKKLKLKDDIEDKQELEVDEESEGYKVLYFWHFKQQKYIERKLED